jgi:hypothetical protein
MLYATVRATAQTAAEYRQLGRRGSTQWREQAQETQNQLPDLSRRYPLSAGLAPHAAHWQDTPRAALTSSVRLLATALAA